MTKLRVVIVDDEPPARARLRSLLQKDPEIEIVAVCADGFEAVDAIRSLNPHLVFLDIQMPEKSGFDVIDEIGIDNIPAVIFVTAYDQYALKAFEVSAIDYLLKPFDEERFLKTTGRAKRQIKAQQKVNDPGQLLALIEKLNKRSEYLERIALNNDGRIILLKAEEIDWLSAEKNYVRIHAGKISGTIRETLNNIESQLNPKRFARIHRSTIVNLDRIREIQQLFHHGYRAVMRDGTQLPISRKYHHKIPRIAQAD